MLKRNQCFIHLSTQPLDLSLGSKGRDFAM